MAKALLIALIFAFAIALPSVCSANVPVSVPEPATAILMLSAAGGAAAIAALKRLF